jgi:maltose phosphorylase
MIRYLQVDPWKIIEEGFKRKHHRASESIFSIGNGRFGQRANHEEKYTGPTLQGSYVAGVYYPDKTRVGWWKNGYPEYFAKVLNSTNWIGINVFIDDEELDFGTVTISDFRRELDMKAGLLRRSFVAEMNAVLPGTRDSGEPKRIKVEVERFCSMADDETAAIRYAVTPLNFGGTITFQPYLSGKVYNHDSNYDELFWDRVDEYAASGEGWVHTRTRKTEFDVVAGMHVEALLNGKALSLPFAPSASAFYAGNTVSKDVHQHDTLAIYKYVGLVSSLNYSRDKLVVACQAAYRRASATGYSEMKAKHAARWSHIWDLADITIEGDDEAQQAIRFNIFQLNQTFTGEDARLNIGPKGFTGEKYGGSTYWDTEAYCLPFYMGTKPHTVARQLLMYRYNQLPRAIENAAKLGFGQGAALYPMVTMNGEECHNEWEITFEEIHRNGAIAYAIYHYLRYTGDMAYLLPCGMEVLIAIARFWAQRVNWSEDKKQWVMLGVTGPNEYENNVNNNWYTNYIARWCMEYCASQLIRLHTAQPEAFEDLRERTHLLFETETADWKAKASGMYLGQIPGSQVFLQQDGFLDKELRPADSVDPAQRPINQHWSWDRILRSCFIKQADVLQGLYFFEDYFDEDTIRANFDFYEPMTVHESSLSPCVHSILAAKLGKKEKAYEMYMRTARLDLDDYNHEAHEGLHITSMAGTWMSVVHGFGGMRIQDDRLAFAPILPEAWQSYSFKVLFRGETIRVHVDRSGYRTEIVARNP